MYTEKGTGAHGSELRAMFSNLVVQQQSWDDSVKDGDEMHKWDPGISFCTICWNINQRTKFTASSTKLLALRWDSALGGQDNGSVIISLVSLVFLEWG